MKHLKFIFIGLTVFSISYIDAIRTTRSQTGRTTEPGQEPTRQQATRQQTRQQTRPQEEMQEEPQKPMSQQATAEAPSITPNLHGIKENSTFKDIYGYIKDLVLQDAKQIFSNKKFSDQFITDTLAQVRTANLSNIELEALLRTARDFHINIVLTGDNTQDLAILKGINEQIKDLANPQKRSTTIKPAPQAVSTPSTQSRGGIRSRRQQTGGQYRGGM